MPKTICLCLSVFVILLLAVSFVQAAAYVKFDGIDGESQDKDHPSWSDIQSFSQGISQSGSKATGSIRRRGDVVFEDFTITKEIDKASPKLAESLCLGTVFSIVEIELVEECLDTGPVNYYKYELTNAKITNYQVNGTAENRPLEQISFSFEEIRVKYEEVDKNTCESKGIIQYIWNLITGSIP